MPTGIGIGLSTNLSGALVASFVPTFSPTLYWPLSESSGSRIDLIHSKEYLETGIVGSVNDPVLGLSVLFDGSAQMLRSIYDSNYLYLPANTKWSWSIWARFNAAPADWGGFFSWWDGTTSDRIFAQYTSPTNVYTYYFAAGGGASSDWSWPYTVDTPMHIAISDDPADLGRFYVNGELVTTYNANIDHSSRTADFLLGRYAETTEQYPFEGHFAKNLYVKDYAFTEDDIAWLYNGGSPRSNSEILALAA